MINNKGLMRVVAESKSGRRLGDDKSWLCVPNQDECDYLYPNGSTIKVYCNNLIVAVFETKEWEEYE